ncbi:probable multidrug resistance-associated protein lethal(2)03659 isoform X1 [Cydia splendana]|uniref:probable multidrug resistance-associated protein lethal(2)03659 isoform X1 n=1 Tax=Cydia splendana TaxID=1100963 RepID=UPI00300D0689
MDTGPKQRRQVNPRYTANIFSILTFGWTLETFKLGYNRDIGSNDLYAPLPEHRSDVLGNALQRAWEHEVRTSAAAESKPSLWRALIKVFGAEFMLYGLILAAMEFIIRLQQPLFLGLVLRYYNPIPDSHNNTNRYFSRLFHYYEAAGGVSWGEAVFFSLGVVLTSVVNVLVQHPFMMAAMHIGMKMRVGVCSLIYRKALRVSLQTMADNGAGLVVNLMANDVNRFDTGPLFAHYLWIGPLETLIMTMFLYRELGTAAVYGILTIVAVIPFQIFLGTRTAYYRRKTALKSDDRVRLTKEIVMGIEVIKMYTWEEPFRALIDDVRRQEIHNIKMTSYIRGVIMSFIMFTSRFGIFVTVLVYAGAAPRVTVETVFFLTCYYNIIKQTMTLYFPQGVGQIAEMNVAVQRIRDYLISEECQFPPKTFEPSAGPTETVKKRVTIVVDPTVPPRAPLSPASTSNIQDSNKNQGKDKVMVNFEGASSSWIKSSDQYDAEDINLQIYSCSLTTIIGAVGSGKSTLLHMILGELPCRTGSLTTAGTASYASQEPWMFVGSVRQNILFGQPFVKSRYIEVCKVCALERDISLFPHGDRTIVGERGVSLSGGQRARINLARAIYKDADIYLLDDPLSAVDTQVAKHIFEKCIKRYLANKTVVLVTHQIQFIKSVDKIVIMDKSKILVEGALKNLNKQELSLIRVMTDNVREVHEEEPSASAVTSVAQPSTVSAFRKHWSMLLDDKNADLKPEVEMQSLGRVKSSVYKEYFLAGAACPYAVGVAFMFVFAQLCASGSDSWLSIWSNAEDRLTGDATVDNIIWSESGMTRQFFVLIFGILTLATVIVALLRACMFFSLCMLSSIRLHDKMFECISRSPMSFFHANPSGRILNRFSKDLGAVDELLPQAMIDCFQIILNLVGVIVVILVMDITLLIPITAAIIIFYILRVIYIRTSGAVKRLEGITRSPVFGHLTATVQGLSTVRAFGAEALLAAEFDRHQDLHGAAWYLFITCSRAFGYFLDIICLLFIVCVTFGCIMKTDIDASTVGLAITQSISLTGIFQWGMRQSAEMENQMTSVERVLEYTNLTQEPALRAEEREKPPPDWPSDGAIHFDQLSLKYAPEGHYVLHKLQFNIQPHEKIGIVGRTGAGKSSIIQALFRLAYLEGVISIDGVNISSIGLHDLREKISIIPQEPVLFSGTMRKNLDPFGEYTDDILLSALSKVELISNEEDPADALNKIVAEGGCNMSVGSRQLVCLARAIVRANRVLLLDEATANVDPATDALVQAAIRTHFQHCTVLTIAHRLNTVIDSDKILVLDAGRLVEYAPPHLLLQNEKGAFRRMVEQTGAAMAAELRQVAEESYKKTQD